MQSTNAKPAVYLIHFDRNERDRLRAFIARQGFCVQDFPSVDAFLNKLESGGHGCLVVDLQDSAACDLLERLRSDAAPIPVIMIAEGGDVPTAVRAMRAGADAFIEKPYAHGLLMREIRRLVA